MDVSLEGCDPPCFDAVLNYVSNKYPYVEVLDIRAKVPLLPDDKRCFSKLLECLMLLAAPRAGAYRVTTYQCGQVVHVFGRSLFAAGRIDSNEWKLLCDLEEVNSASYPTHVLFPRTHEQQRKGAYPANHASLSFHYRQHAQQLRVPVVRGPMINMVDFFADALVQPQPAPPSPQPLTWAYRAARGKTVAVP